MWWWWWGGGGVSLIPCGEGGVCEGVIKAQSLGMQRCILQHLRLTFGS